MLINHGGIAVRRCLRCWPLLALFCQLDEAVDKEELLLTLVRARCENNDIMATGLKNKNDSGRSEQLLEQ